MYRNEEVNMKRDWTEHVYWSIMHYILPCRYVYFLHSAFLQPSVQVALWERHIVTGANADCEVCESHLNPFLSY